MRLVLEIKIKTKIQMVKESKKEMSDDDDGKQIFTFHTSSSIIPCSSSFSLSLSLASSTLKNK